MSLLSLYSQISPEKRSIFFKGSGIAMLWIFLNIVLQFLTKDILTLDHFDFPLFMALIQHLVVFLLSAIFVIGFQVEEYPIAQLRQSIFLVLVVSVFSTLSGAFQNLSVSYISISINQTVKSSTPVVTMILTYTIFGTTSSRVKILSAVLLLFGIFLGVYANQDFYSLGFVFAFLSVLCSCLSTVTAGHLLDSIPPLSLLLTTAVPSFLLCLGMFYFSEYPRFQHESMQTDKIDFELIPFASSLGFVYLITSNYLIFYTSALYYGMLGSLKVVLLIFLSMYFFPTKVSSLNIFGMIVATIAFCIFNFASFLEFFFVDSRKENTDSIIKESIDD